MWPGVTILLATRNGAPYLGEQLDSILRQDFADWRLRASDDGSTDGTLAMLEQFRRGQPAGRVEVVAGPRRGFVANFLSLAAPVGLAGDCYAFADQDDIWLPDKLGRGMAWLRMIPADTPALYCGRSRLIGEGGEALGFSPLYRRPPSFANALVQNIAGGNTMMFNEAARALLARGGVDADVPYHDWWLYLLVSGCGGAVFYDPAPAILYRQHGHNLVGDRMGRFGGLDRLRSLFERRFGLSLDRFAAALESARDLLTPGNRNLLARFSAARSLRGPLARWLAIRDCGVYRQSLMEGLAFRVLAMIGKV